MPLIQEGPAFEAAWIENHAPFMCGIPVCEKCVFYAFIDNFKKQFFCTARLLNIGTCCCESYQVDMTQTVLLEVALD